MLHSLYALAFLACPLGMGLMMWMMMRGRKHQAPSDDIARKAELRRLQAEIDDPQGDAVRRTALVNRQ